VYRHWVCWRSRPLRGPLTRGARNTLALRYSEHGRERRSDDCCQLSRWKILIYEAQRLDEGNGLHDVTQQGQRPPGVVGGELQEPHVEEPPPQGGPFVERVEQGGGRRVEHRSAVTLTPVPLPQCRSKLAHKQHGRPPTTKIAS
jgi:hypothetical protein